MNASRLTITKLIVADIDAVAAFYQPVFELQELMRMDFALGGEPVQEIVFSIGAHAPAEPFLALFRFVDRAPPVPGDTILGFTVPAIDPVLERITARGGRVVVPPALYGEGPGATRIAFAADPEGRLIQLLQGSVD